ncbi:hypothetical protein ACFL3N_02455 [Candidatus Omnitrophota bacterium]
MARKRRKRFIVDWRLQMKYAILITAPMLLLGFFSITAGFKIGQGIIQNQRQQLLTQVATVEGSIKSIEKFYPDSKTSKRVLGDIRKLKLFLQNLIGVNIYELRRLTKMMVFVTVIFVLASLFFSLAVSHRIAGPIFRLEKIIYLIAKGQKTTPVRTRATDEFKSLTAALEELRKKLLDSSENRKELVSELTGKTRALKQKFDKGEMKKQDIDSLISELSEWEKRCA